MTKTEKKIKVVVQDQAGNIGAVQTVTVGKGTVLHVIAGNEEWKPVSDEMKNLLKLFVTAIEDSDGSVVVTREGVRTEILCFPE